MKNIHGDGAFGNDVNRESDGFGKSRNNLRHDVLPEAYALRRKRWQQFIVLTFASQQLPARIRKRMVEAWLRRLASERAEYRRLRALYRFERGASEDHVHAHVLLAGLKDIPPKFRDTVQHLWLRQGGGWSCIRKFDPLRDGVGYVLKASANYGRSRRYRDDEIDIPTLWPSLDAFWPKKRKRRQRRG